MSQAPLQTAPPDAEFDDSVGYLIARVRSMMNHVVTQQTTVEFGITSTQASILYKLRHGHNVVAAELARDYGVDASAITRLLDRLEARGLILRARSDKDRRVIHLSLTPEGRNLAQDLPPIYQRALDRMLRNFTPEEAGFLKNMLRRMLANGSEEAP